MSMKQNPMCVAQSMVFKTIFILIVGVHITFGQAKVEKIDALMKLSYEYGQFNGSVLVTEHGNIIYQKGFGLADMEWDIPNQSDTKFRLGSITKQFTSMLTLQLVQQGKLKLDGKVSDYLPDYPKKTGDKITIHQLLTHTSGIPSYTDFRDFYSDLSRNPSTPQAFVKLFADSALLFEPGAKFSYSNSGYFLLGAIIEKVTGKSYEEVLQENIFNPLNMKNTGYDHQSTILKKRAQGYSKKGNLFVNADYIEMSLPYSAGALYSTVEDLYLWDQALYTDKLLPEQTRELFFKPYISAFGGWYGYGWFISKGQIGNTVDSVNVIEHGGSVNGFCALISRIPSERYLVVLLNNTNQAPLDKISRAIRGILFDKPYDLPKKSIAEEVFSTIMEHGIAAGIEQYHNLRDKHSDIYVLLEEEMIRIGYKLLRTGKVNESIEVFKMYVDAFPKSSNAYDCLGDAYRVHGDKQLAIDNYQKCLDLDPTTTYAIEALKKLQTK